MEMIKMSDMAHPRLGERNGEGEGEGILLMRAAMTNRAIG